MRKVFAAPALLALIPSPAEAMMNFKAKVTAYTADGDLIEEQTLDCPNQAVFCQFVFEVPFDGKVGTAALTTSEPWPNELSASMLTSHLNLKLAT